MARRDTALRYFNEQKDIMDLKVKSGIELNRKGSAHINIKGENLPENITVEVEQKNHEFKFGANIFMLDEFETEDMTGEKNQLLVRGEAQDLPREVRRAVQSRDCAVLLERP